MTINAVIRKETYLEFFYNLCGFDHAMGPIWIKRSLKDRNLRDLAYFGIENSRKKHIWTWMFFIV